MERISLSRREINVLVSGLEEFTFDRSFKMWVLVENFNLFLPVKLVPPIRDHLLQVGGVETVVESGTLQGWCVAGVVKTLVQILEQRIPTKQCDRILDAIATPNHISKVH